MFPRGYQTETVSSRPVYKAATKSLEAQEFDLLVDGIMIRDKVKRSEAMRRAAREHND